MRIRIAALAMVALAAPAAHAQLFKCVKDGKTVYQDSACDDAAKQSTVRAPAAAPAAPPKPADAKAGSTRPSPAAAPAASSGSALDTVASFTICSERVPNFANKYTSAYQDWKSRNAAALSRLANEPDASQLDARLRQERERPATENMADRCADVATSIQPPVDRGAPKVVSQ